MPLLLLFPALALIVPHAGSIILFVLAGVGVCVLLYTLPASKTAALAIRDLSHQEKWLMLCFALFPLSALLSWMLGDFSRAGWRELETPLRMFAFIPIYFLFRQIDLSQQTLVRSFILGALLAGLSAILAITWQTGFVTYSGGRVAGPYGELTFGQWSILFSALAALAYTQVKETRLLQVVLLLIVGLGLFAGFASGTRGAWLALPVLAVVTYFYLRPHFTGLQKISLLLALILAGVFLYQLPATNISSRAQTAINEAMDYWQAPEDNNKVKRTSMGARFEMWKGSWRMFREAPLLGVGEGGYQPHMQAQKERGEMHFTPAKYSHPHNEFLRILAQRGLFGFAFLLAIFVLPLLTFNQARRETDERRLLGFAGIIICVGYLIFGLTETLFSRNIMVASYVVMIAYLMAAIHQYTDLKQHEHITAK